jgi:hypothetical protein
MSNTCVKDLITGRTWVGGMHIVVIQIAELALGLPPSTGPGLSRGTPIDVRFITGYITSEGVFIER